MTHLIEIVHDRLPVRLAYAGTENLFNRAIYKEVGLGKCYAHPDLHACLMLLPPELEKLKLKLVIFDCYRPIEVQREMWRILPDERYVAPPERGSLHNRGAAVDCYLAQEDGKPLEFPTAPDGWLPGIDKDFDAWMKYLEKAHHTYECTPEERRKCENRDLLKSLMTGCGLEALNEEWWHYQLPNASGYPLIETYP